MSRYDELFDDLTTHDSVFTNKSALDPLAEPDEIVPRTDQERALAIHRFVPYGPYPELH